MRERSEGEKGRKEGEENKGRKNIYLHLNKMSLEASSPVIATDSWGMYFYLFNILKHIIPFKLFQLSEHCHVLHNDVLVNNRQYT